MPIVNSFQPDRKGQVGGTLTAQGKVTGSGTTGASLQKNLAGQFDFNSTNLNLSVVNIRNPLLKTLVNVVGTEPELLKNPGSAVSGLLGSLTGGGGGLTDDLSKSPLDAIIARGSIGAGRVNLQQAVVRSAAFEADAQGAVTLSPVLTNSVIEIPVSVSLSRPVMQRLNLLAADTPTNALYAKLPNFLTLRGTVGNPKSDLDKVALLKTAAQGVTGGKAGGVLQGFQGLRSLVPGGSSVTNSPGGSTNQPSGAGGMLKGLFDGLDKSKK
jgi:hypothetical protein